MEISELEVEDYDIPWFAVDSVGSIAKFTSGIYGKLPKTVTKSVEELDFLTDFFIEQLQESTTGKVDSTAFDRVSLISDTLEVRQQFSAQHLEISSKGLYSYDSYDAEPTSGAYFRINLPLQPVKIDMLPEDVKNVLTKVILSNVIFAEESMISESNIINA